MSTPLSPEEITRAREKLPGWVAENEALTKTFEFGSFREAISFMVRISYEAEEMNHHPDWSNIYNRVVVRLNTHDAGNRITGKDVDLAMRIERIAWVK
jgi:4a-hydroxytetrahydrobiopterin dehydratase